MHLLGTLNGSLACGSHRSLSLYFCCFSLFSLSADNLQTLKQRLNEGHLEVFNIQSPELVGLVIGVNGKNIKRVEKMSGVLNVRVDSSKSQVSILAKSEAEAKAAREQLEFVEQRFPILKRQAGRVVGKSGDTDLRCNGCVRMRRVRSSRFRVLLLTFALSIVYFFTLQVFLSHGGHPARLRRCAHPPGQPAPCDLVVLVTR